MADTIKTKRITDLPEDTDVNDNDLFMAGSNGTASLRKKKWSTLLAKIKSKLLANNLTTTAEGYALDARQGKALKDQVDQLNTKIGWEAENAVFASGWTGTISCVTFGFGIRIIYGHIKRTSSAAIAWGEEACHFSKYQCAYWVPVSAFRTTGVTIDTFALNGGGTMGCYSPEYDKIQTDIWYDIFAVSQTF